MESCHIIIEKNIPFARGLFDDVAKVSYLSPDEITADAMRSAHALITRTRTKCNSELLSDSVCKIIASATIGLDHVDVNWCNANGITVENAPGCNAPAVAQYVLASIITAYGKDLSGLKLGVVGVGHVGSIVCRWAKALGMIVLPCDPPRAEAEGADGFCSMTEIAQEADVITVHTPYAVAGNHPTHHLFSTDFFNRLQRKPMVINSARGPIVDTEALKKAIINGQVSRAVIDCWEGEPNIDLDLLQMAYIATPHIAGYSRQGKIRATAMAAKAVARKLNLPEPHLSEPMPPYAPESVTVEAIMDSYNPMVDTELLRANPSNFELLRNKYSLRNEPL